MTVNSSGRSSIPYRGDQRRHDRHLSRLQELEQIRQQFKPEHYDGANSTFPYGVLVGAALNAFLRGLATSPELWEPSGDSSGRAGPSPIQVSAAAGLRGRRVASGVPPCPAFRAHLPLAGAVSSRGITQMIAKPPGLSGETVLIQSKSAVTRAERAIPHGTQF